MKTQQKDYYQTLEITQFATPNQIKRAYRKLAIIHHPDKNHTADRQKQQESIEIFRKISQAYQTLSNSDKKRNYDIIHQFGCSFYKQSKNYSFKDAETLFQNFFKNSNQRYYSNGQDILSSYINGKRVPRKSHDSTGQQESPNSFRYFNTTNNHNNYGYASSNNNSSNYDFSKSNTKNSYFNNGDYSFNNSNTKDQNNNSSPASKSSKKPNAQNKRGNVSQDYNDMPNPTSMDEESNSTNQDTSGFLHSLEEDVVMRSTCTMSRSINGKMVTIKRTTTKKKDGTRNIRQQITDGDNFQIKNYTLAIGQSLPKYFQ